MTPPPNAAERDEIYELLRSSLSETCLSCGGSGVYSSTLSDCFNCHGEGERLNNNGKKIWEYIQSLSAQLATSKEQEEYLASLLSLATISPEDHEAVKCQLAEKEKALDYERKRHDATGKRYLDVAQEYNECVGEIDDLKSQLEAIRKQTGYDLELMHEALDNREKQLAEKERIIGVMAKDRMNIWNLVHILRAALKRIVEFSEIFLVKYCPNGPLQDYNWLTQAKDALELKPENLSPTTAEEESK